MKKKNIIAVIMSVAITASMAGCGSSSADVPEPYVPSAEALETTVITTAAETTTASQTEVIGKSAADAQEYMEILRGALHDYSEAYAPFSDAAKNNDFDAARKAVDDSVAALTTIQNISVPAEYADQQKKMAKAAADELEFLEMSRQMVDLREKMVELKKVKDDPTAEELADILRLQEEVEEFDEKIANFESDFTDVFMETIKMLKADIENS